MDQNQPPISLEGIQLHVKELFYQWPIKVKTVDQLAFEREEIAKYNMQRMQKSGKK